MMTQQGPRGLCETCGWDQGQRTRIRVHVARTRGKKRGGFRVHDRTILIAQLDLSMIDSKSCAKDGIATKHVGRISERDSRIEILRVRKVKCGSYAAVTATAGQIERIFVIVLLMKRSEIVVPHA